MIPAHILARLRAMYLDDLSDDDLTALEEAIRVQRSHRLVAGAAYLTAKQTAARLGLCTMTVYSQLNAGKLPGVKVGGSWRISAAALEAMLLPPTLHGKPCEAFDLEDT